MQQQPKELPGNITLEKFEKRRKEIQDVLTDFVDSWNSLETAAPAVLKENASSIVTIKYFELSENVIKRYLPKKSFTNKYKVASGSEIAAMFTLPIRFSDSSFNIGDIREINSRFALQLAFSMLFNVHFEETGDFPPELDQSDELATILEHHRLWLSRMSIDNLDTAPTFINSNFWQAFFFASTKML